MADGNEPHAALNPWIPVSDPFALAILGKGMEENGELVSAMGRCLIQGIDGSEPVTGKPNREWLEDELADAAAVNCMAVRFFGLDTARMEARADAKVQHLERWHGLIADHVKADASPPAVAFAIGRLSAGGVDPVEAYLNGYLARLPDGHDAMVRVHVETALRGFAEAAQEALRVHVAGKVAAGGGLPASSAKVEGREKVVPLRAKPRLREVHDGDGST